MTSPTSMRGSLDARGVGVEHGSRSNLPRRSPCILKVDARDSASDAGRGGHDDPGRLAPDPSPDPLSTAGQDGPPRDTDPATTREFVRDESHCWAIRTAARPRSSTGSAAWADRELSGLDREVRWTMHRCRTVQGHRPAGIYGMDLDLPESRMPRLSRRPLDEPTTRSSSSMPPTRPGGSRWRSRRSVAASPMAALQPRGPVPGISFDEERSRQLGVPYRRERSDRPGIDALGRSHRNPRPVAADPEADQPVGPGSTRRRREHGRSRAAPHDPSPTASTRRSRTRSSGSWSSSR